LNPLHPLADGEAVAAGFKKQIPISFKASKGNITPYDLLSRVEFAVRMETWVRIPLLPDRILDATSEDSPGKVSTLFPT
jgi:hypothetical protein